VKQQGYVAKTERGFLGSKRRLKEIKAQSSQLERVNQKAQRASEKREKRPGQAGGTIQRSLQPTGLADSFHQKPSYQNQETPFDQKMFLKTERMQWESKAGDRGPGGRSQRIKYRMPGSFIPLE
jgi:hypothetical protein